MNEIESALLSRVLSIIYCRPISKEFRQPVEVLYASDTALITHYSAVIQYPMDLGTLLHGAMKKKLKISNYKDGLKLVFRNSIQFNQDTNIIMNNIAKHLDTFSCNLYEEAFCQPYQSIANVVNENSDIAHREFLKLRTNRRINHYGILDSQLLKYSEVQAVIESVQIAAATINNQFIQQQQNIAAAAASGGNNDLATAASIAILQEFPRELFSIMEQCLKLALEGLQAYNLLRNAPYLNLMEILKPLLQFLHHVISNNNSASSSTMFRGYGVGNNNNNNNNNMDFTATKVLTLDFIQQNQLPALLILLNPSSLSTTTSSSVASSHTANAGSHDHVIMQKLSPYLPFLLVLDENVGFLLAGMYERITRGCVYSSIWAAPISCCWVTGTTGDDDENDNNDEMQSGEGDDKNKNNTDRPGMILIITDTSGANDSTAVTLMSEVNASRVSTSIAQDLNQEMATTIMHTFGGSDCTSMNNNKHSTVVELADQFQNAIGLKIPSSSIVPPSSSASSYVLIEYFGSHELQWVPVERVQQVNTVQDFQQLFHRQQKQSQQQQQQQLQQSVVKTEVEKEEELQLTFEAFQTLHWLSLKSTEFIDHVMYCSANSNNNTNNSTNNANDNSMLEAMKEELYDSAAPTLKQLERSIHKSTSNSSSNGGHGSSRNSNNNNKSSHTTKSSSSTSPSTATVSGVDNTGREQQGSSHTAATTTTTTLPTGAVVGRLSSSGSNTTTKSRSTSTGTKPVPPPKRAYHRRSHDGTTGSTVTNSNAKSTSSGNIAATDNRDDGHDNDASDVVKVMQRQQLQLEIEQLFGTTTLVVSTTASQQDQNKTDVADAADDIKGEDVAVTAIKDTGTTDVVATAPTVVIGPFITSKCPPLTPTTTTSSNAANTTTAFTKKARSIHRCKYFGAWTARQAKFPPTAMTEAHEVAKDDTGDVNVTITVANRKRKTPSSSSTTGTARAEGRSGTGTTTKAVVGWWNGKKRDKVTKKFISTTTPATANSSVDEVDEYGNITYDNDDHHHGVGDDDGNISYDNDDNMIEGEDKDDEDDDDDDQRDTAAITGLLALKSESGGASKVTNASTTAIATSTAVSAAHAKKLPLTIGVLKRKSSATASAANTTTASSSSSLVSTNTSEGVQEDDYANDDDENEEQQPTSVVAMDEEHIEGEDEVAGVATTTTTTEGVKKVIVRRRRRSGGSSTATGTGTGGGSNKKKIVGTSTTSAVDVTGATTATDEDADVNVSNVTAPTSTTTSTTANANIHTINANLQNQARIGAMFDSHSGCSHYIAGEGVIHTRAVDIQSSALFNREDRKCVVRKELLRKELIQITAKIQHLHDLASARLTATSGASSNTSGGDTDDTKKKASLLSAENKGGEEEETMEMVVEINE